MTINTSTDPKPPDAASTAERILWAARQAKQHLESEYHTEDGAPIMESFTDSDILAFTPPCTLDDDQTLRLELLESRDDVRAFYDAVCSAADIQGADILVQVGGSWYTFMEGVFHTRTRATGDAVSGTTLVLLPSGHGPGVSGE